MTIQVLSNEKPQEPAPEAGKPAEGALPGKPAEGTESAPVGESQPEQNESEESDPSEAEGEAGSEGEGSQEQEPKDAADAESKPKKKSGFQRRVDKLNARIADKEREAAYWREQALKGASSAGKPDSVEPAKAAAAEGEPQPEQFEDHRSYVKALAKYEAKQILDEERQGREKTQLQTELQRQVETYNEKARSFAAKVGDFDEVIAEVGDIPMSPAVRHVLLSSENGPELAYHLAKDPEAFARVCKLNPADAYLAMGELKAKLSLKSSGTQEPKPKTITKAPKPLNPVTGGKASVQKSIYEAHALSQADYERVRREQMKQRSRA